MTKVLQKPKTRKPIVTLHNVTQGSQAWLDLREGLYTGSNAHKLLKYGNIDYALSQINGFKGNFWTNRGHILENEAIELYEQIKSTSISRVGFVTNSIYPDCGYSPDGFARDILIEVKCFSKDKHMTIVRGDIPMEIHAQVQYGMMICNQTMCHLIAYNPDLEVSDAFKVIEIKANRKIHANFRRILRG